MGVARPMERSLVPERPGRPYLSWRIPLWDREWSAVVCRSCKCGELKGLLKCCNVIMWTVSQIH